MMAASKRGRSSSVSVMDRSLRFISRRGSIFVIFLGMYSLSVSLHLLLSGDSGGSGGSGGTNYDLGLVVASPYWWSGGGGGNTFCPDASRADVWNTLPLNSADDPAATPLLQMTFVDHYQNRRLNNDNNASLPLSSSSLVIPSSNDDNPYNPFRVLCTSIRRRLPWGSYKLRCQDLQRWADKCAKDVEIVTGIPMEYLDQMWNRPQNITPGSFWNVHYNSTIFVKSKSGQKHSQYGRRFIDLVDEYNWQHTDVPRDAYELILQTPWQGPVLFPQHKFAVVEHWYNSYPADMALGRDDVPDGIPAIVDDEEENENDSAVSTMETKTIIRPLKIATIWNTRRGLNPTEGGCPSLGSVKGVHYDCLDFDFDIATWYLNQVIPPGLGRWKHHQARQEASCEMQYTLSDPQLGPGKLYYNLFRQYDALVVPVKNHTMKLHFGNVQRAVSQMRSGVPVLLEIRGKVLEDFMDRYNYTCAFRRQSQYGNDEDDNMLSELNSFLESRNNNGNDDPRETKSKHLRRQQLLTFEEAVQQLQNPEVRRECQHQGLEIAKDFSPSAIGQKFLRAVGYQGDFQC